MISDVDKSIEMLLRREIGDNLPFDVSFAIPDRGFGPLSDSRPTINCYLYDICEDQEMRNNEPGYNYPGDGSAEKRKPLLRVKLSYRITAWSPPDPRQGNGNSRPAFDSTMAEHLLLGQVLMILARYPVLPPEILQGLMVDQELPVPAATAQPGEGVGPPNFWKAIGSPLRPSLDYSVTIALTGQEIIHESLVRNKIFGYISGDISGDSVGTPADKQEQLIRIGGYVHSRKKPKTPIPDAWVMLEELNKAGKTGPDGSYVFGNLDCGTYTVAVRAAGYRDAKQKISVPADKPEKNYDFRLEPG